MKGFDRAALDRFITKEPEDNFSLWVEKVYDHFSDEFYDNMADFENSLTEEKWLIKLAGKAVVEVPDVDENGNFKVVTVGYITPEEAAQIIERAAKIYKLVKTKR